MDTSTRRQLDFASRSTFFLFANTTIVIPVSLVAISAELNLSFTQAGSLSLVTALVQLAILLGSVPIASVVGKILPLRWGLWIVAISLVAFTRVSNYITALMIVTIMGLGQAFLEALLTPLVEDIHPDDDGSNQIFLHSFWPLGIIFGTLVIGEALSRGVPWRTIFIVLSAFCIVGGMIYPRTKKANLPNSHGDFSHAREIFSQPVFWMMGLSLFFAGSAEGGFTFWAASYIQLEFDALPRAGGLVTAIFAAGMVAGRITLSRLAKRFTLKRILLVTIVLAFLGSLVIFFINNLIGLYITMAFMGLFVSPFWPALQTYTVRRLNADPTMIMVFLSCMGVLGFSGANFVMGVIGDAADLRLSFLVAPAALALFFVFFLLEKKVKANH